MREQTLGEPQKCCMKERTEGWLRVGIGKVSRNFFTSIFHYNFDKVIFGGKGVTKVIRIILSLKMDC